MSQKKPVSSDIITGLEISAVDEIYFIALPEVYTMPVDTSSIPTNDDLSRSPYLREVNLLTVKANLDLLIGSNFSKGFKTVGSGQQPRRWATQSYHQIWLGCQRSSKWMLHG